MSRKEKLAEEYAKDWEIRQAFLAGYAACEQDARGMVEALEFYAIENSKWVNPETNQLFTNQPSVASRALAKWKERGE